LILGVERDEQQEDNELNNEDRHARPAAEEFPEFSDGHDEDKIPQKRG